MSPIYRQGFTQGVHDHQQEGRLAGAQAQALDQAEAHGEPLLSPTDESTYWLAYHHGRFYARTGTLPDGLRALIEENRPCPVNRFVAVMAPPA